MKKKQLFELAPKGFKVFGALDDLSGRAISRPAGNVPLPRWPNGDWCVELAWYGQYKAKKNLSRLDRGGTLGTYVSQLSHITRLCYRKGITFLELADNDFTNFVKQLMEERKDSAQLNNPESELVKNHAALAHEHSRQPPENHYLPKRKRTSRTVINIAKRTLDFLWFVGKVYGIDDFVGTVIQAERRKYSVKRSDGTVRIQEYWYHKSFPEMSSLRRRQAISDEALTKLRAAIAKIGCSSFMRMRRFAMLRVLQKTGARRIEVVQLTVASVKQAMAMAKPRLLVNTAKGKDGEVRQRLVPIDKQDLVLLDDYIETSRAVVIANTIGSERDHGLLFINSRTGQPLVPNTVTLELHLLAKAAGLNGNAHPHLFRHRFVMVRIQILKDELQIADKASFEQMYVTNRYIAGRLTEETGHASLTSLLPYINDTYPETPQAQIIAERIEADGFAASFKAGVEELAVLKESMPPEEFAARAMRFMGQAVGQISPNK